MLLIRNKPIRMLFDLLEHGNWLILRMFLSRNPDVRRFPGTVFRAYLDIFKRAGRWRSKNILELFPEFPGQRIVLANLPGGGIVTSLEALGLLTMVTHVVAPKFVFEIGTSRGRTALNFAMNSPRERIVYTLDLAPGQGMDVVRELGTADKRLVEESAPGIEFRDQPEAEKIKQVYGDSTVLEFTPYYGRMDIVFVDGGHSSRVARSDTEQASKMARPGESSLRRRRNLPIMWHRGSMRRLWCPCWRVCSSGNESPMGPFVEVTDMTITVQ